MRLKPDKADFVRLAGTHRLIPVFTDLPVDTETPVSLYYKIVGDDPGFMLESAETGNHFGRFSFIGTDPFLRLQAFRNRLELVGERPESLHQPPMQALQSILSRFSCADFPDSPPLSGGAVGYLSFEAVSTWERVRGMNVPDNELLGEFLCCRLLVAMDHLKHSARLIYLAEITSPDADAAAIHDQAASRLQDVITAVQRTLETPRPAPTAPFAPASGTHDDAARKTFLSRVRTAKEHIAAGDVFQVVLSHPFRRPLAERPFSLYRRLRRLNPSPYMFFINFGGRQLIGASPEMLVKLQNGKVSTCPIAGTRPRGRDAGEDALLAAELLADGKECAEHAMLVDLGRNDIGRISLPGTVEVTRMMDVENFSHVMHIVSEVCGTLDPRFAPTDALAACFPAGTVSGAPKIRAMEIISGLEDQPRGPYAGAVGYFDFRGNMDTCITIRTFSVDGGTVTIQTGAGIVADSVPEKEYEEILHKAKVLFQVLEGD